jgi:hypothetical protein
MSVTAEDVAEIVRRVGAFHRSDPGLAMAMEHRLYTAVLGAITMGADAPQKLAAAALQSQVYEFDRAPE